MYIESGIYQDNTLPLYCKCKFSNSLSVWVFPLIFFCILYWKWNIWWKFLSNNHNRPTVAETVDCAADNMKYIWNSSILASLIHCIMRWGTALAGCISHFKNPLINFIALDKHKLTNYQITKLPYFSRWELEGKHGNLARFYIPE